MLGIGIDTGGTCTDAVIYDLERKEVLASGKVLTTKGHLQTGICRALDALPVELVRKAETMSLSTTLATNACVENKGSRAKLLMFGFDSGMMEHLKDVYASYGFRDCTQFVMIDAKAENIHAEPYDPDWEELAEKAPEYFRDCDSIGIVQKNPTANGGRFELTARQILRDRVTQPLTIAYDISDEPDILKTCASTLLNARLIPLITEFMEAVHLALRLRGLDIPFSIVRSDGTLMSEEMARTCPVETLLCGPAASVCGGCELSREKSGILVDMGGTTTDIALIHDARPVTARDGIYIGQWKTSIKGIYVDTFGLGGDSAVRYRNGELYLDTERIIPVSVLASQFENVVPELKKLSESGRISSCMLHEFYVLQKDIAEKEGYSDMERKICRILEEKPLIMTDLASAIGRDPYFLKMETGRLEQDGVIIRSGLTPTDMMLLKGDFRQYKTDAARETLKYLFFNIRQDIGQVPDIVYEMVTHRMYHNLGRILLCQQNPAKLKNFRGKELDAVLEVCYEQAVQETDRPEECTGLDSLLELKTQLPLIGVGAPVHVFLPRVANLLHTRAEIPDHAEAANAVGAISGRKIAFAQLIIKAEYVKSLFKGYSLFDRGKKYWFDEKDEAVAFGKQVVSARAQERAQLQGMEGATDITVNLEENRIGHVPEGLLLEIILSASACAQQ